MPKKIIIFIVSLFMCLYTLPNKQIYAEDIVISASSVVLMEANSGEILFEKNSDEPRSIASITKVMTLILTMEALENGKINLEQELTASAYASSMGGSDIWLKEGEKMSVNDLIKATVVMSANDAAVVLAEEIGGTTETFVQMMNEKAKELGMTNTCFKNCNGLDEEGHLSTAKDVAIMSRELIKHTKIFDYSLTWIDYVRDGQTQLVNTNKLIKTYKGITGLKTGTTSLAGSCISATASRDGLDLIAVVLGASSTNDRFATAKNLLDYGFSNWMLIKPKYEVPAEIDILNGMQKTVKTHLEKAPELVIAKSEKDNIICKIEIDEELSAPINQGDEIAYLKVYLGNELKIKLEITSKENVEEINFLRVLISLLSRFKI